jgi:hypothetical protein
VGRLDLATLVTSGVARYFKNQKYQIGKIRNILWPFGNWVYFPRFGLLFRKNLATLVTSTIIIARLALHFIIALDLFETLNEKSATK